MSTELSEVVAAMILERQRAREINHSQRTSALTELRAEFKRRRDAGLKRRHEARLARNRAARAVVEG